LPRFSAFLLSLQALRSLLQASRDPYNAGRVSRGLQTKQYAFVLADLLCATPAFAQQPLKVVVDGTFATHAMPKVGGGGVGFNIDLENEIGERTKRPAAIGAFRYGQRLADRACGGDLSRHAMAGGPAHQSP